MGRGAHRLEGRKGYVNRSYLNDLFGGARLLTEGPPDFAALNEQKTEIRIQYKDVTSGIFKDIARNELVIRVQPGEAVYLKMNAKSPGLSMKTVATEMDLTYKRRFSDLKIAEAYESLILSVLHNDHSNFVRDDELDIAWKIFTPILHYIDGQSFIRIRDLLVWVLCLIFFFFGVCVTPCATDRNREKAKARTIRIRIPGTGPVGRVYPEIRGIQTERVPLAYDRSKQNLNPAALPLPYPSSSSSSSSST